MVFDFKNEDLIIIHGGIMKTEIIRFLDFRKKVRFENVNLVYESGSAVLVEVDSESIWLRKSEIKLEKMDDCLTLEIPRWLVKRKFNSKVY